VLAEIASRPLAGMNFHGLDNIGIIGTWTL
jgi:hypothetical protein